MSRKLLIGSLALNVCFLGAIIAGAFMLSHFGKNFTRIPAERWRTQFDLLTDRTGGIVFLGDSITEGGHWSEIFDNAAVLNRGIGGDTTQDLLERIEQVYALRPAKLFLMIGVNDLNRGLPVASVLDNYRALFDGFSARIPCTRIYVQSVLPVNSQWIMPASNADISALNAFLASESQRRGYTYIDLAREFTDANGELSRALSNDGIHLLGPGYRLWRDLIRMQVEQ